MGVIKMTHSHINKAKKPESQFIIVLQSSKTDTAKSLMF